MEAYILVFREGQHIFEGGSSQEQRSLQEGFIRLSAASLWYLVGWHGEKIKNNALL